MPSRPIIPQPQLVNVALPSRGLDLSSPFAAQPKGTTPAAVNVRGFDHASGRRRLSRRAGLTKYTSNQLNGTASIQCLDALVGTQYFPGNTAGAGGGQATIPGSGSSSITGLLARWVVTAYEVAGSSGNTWSDHIGGNDGTLTNFEDVYGFHADTHTNGAGGLILDGTDDYVDVGVNATLNLTSAGTIMLWAKVSDATHARVAVAKGDRASAQTNEYALVFRGSSIGWELSLADASNHVEVGTGSAGYPGDNVWHHVAVTWDGSTIKTYINATQQSTGSQTYSAAPLNKPFRLGANGNVGAVSSNWYWAGSMDDVRVYNRALTAAEIAAVYAGSDTSATLGAFTGTSPTLYNRAVTLVGVAGGTVGVLYSGTWYTTLGGASALHATTPAVRSAPNAGLLYFADGANWKYYNPSTNTVSTWAAVSGALPVDSGGNKPRLICTWRGRTVLSGLPLDPSNWFMSAVNDATNWNYAPSPSVETQAVAGNNAPAGLVGDVVTALIPYTDEVLVFGCDHSIWQMSGDPMAGGRLDVVSDITGIAWGQAWTRTPNGTLYFFGGRGAIYQVVPGGIPQRVSQPIDQPLANLNMANVLVRLAYDERWEGFHVWITPVAGGVTTHYYYDEVAQAWWPDAYANTYHSPFSVLAYSGDSAADRTILVGGQDGWVRQPSGTAIDDDGTPIVSSVLVGPVTYKGGWAFRLQDVQADLAVGGGSLAWQLRASRSAQVAQGSTPLFSGLFTPDRNHSQAVRASGVAAYLLLSRGASEAPWSVEAVMANLMPLTQGRQRIF